MCRLGGCTFTDSESEGGRAMEEDDVMRGAAAAAARDNQLSLPI